MKNLLTKGVAFMLCLLLTTQSFGWGSTYQTGSTSRIPGTYYAVSNYPTSFSANAAAQALCESDERIKLPCTGPIRAFQNMCVSIARGIAGASVREFYALRSTAIEATSETMRQCTGIGTRNYNCMEIYLECDGTAAPPPTGNSSSNSSNVLVYAGVGAVGVGALLWFFKYRKKRTYEITVGYSLSETDNGLSYNFGGQVDYAGENWDVNIAANHAVIDNSFSGLEYKTTGNYYGDLFNLSFSEKAQEGKTDYDIVFSKEFEHGNLKLSPTYRMQSVWNYAGNGLKTDTANSLKLNSVLTYENWLINPSAGLHWDSFNFGDNQTEFRVMAVHKF